MERLNKEVKRRSKIIGVFPSAASTVRLMGSLLIEETDRWSASRKIYYGTACKELEKRVPALASITRAQRLLREAA